MAEHRRDNSSDQILRFGRAYTRVGVYLQLGLGVLLLLLAYHTGFERATLLLGGQSISGQIVRYEAVAPVRSSNAPWFKAVVQFRLDTQLIEFTDWNSREYAGGVPSDVAVLYDPYQPQQAMIRRGNLLDWMPWAPAGLLGALLLLVGLRGCLHRVR
ncbi:DUF3592 domain-containing protein [Chitinibacter sp. GC72]|uniref:DUF3592 domain-containing protein n=1 Tax=Chitinibacter sp. GC72 TaxID=1526917 RepID=UPI0012F804E7|nr:DUF3592 domain-containing protein [Chitinibacter sp. GC72]